MTTANRKFQLFDHIDATNGFATFSANPNNSTFPDLTINVTPGYTLTNIAFGTLGLSL